MFTVNKRETTVYFDYYRVECTQQTARVTVKGSKTWKQKLQISKYFWGEIKKREDLTLKSKKKPISDSTRKLLTQGKLLFLGKIRFQFGFAVASVARENINDV